MVVHVDAGLTCGVGRRIAQAKIDDMIKSLLSPTYVLQSSS